MLDFIEEFRQVAIDRVIWGLLNRQFSVGQENDGKLTKETRSSFADHILKHQGATMRYDGKRVPIRIIIQTQARKLASFLRADCAEYIAFKATY